MTPTNDMKISSAGTGANKTNSPPVIDEAHKIDY